MKAIAKFFVLGAALLFLASCANNANTGDQKISIEQEGAHRGGATMMSFQGQQVAAEVINLQKKAYDNADEAEAAKQIFSNLMATKAKAMVDVQLTMSDEPVEDGILVFSLDAQDSKKVELQMFDEEGFGMAANNTIGVNQGKNYKALNVTGLDNGTYTLLLKDEDGRELRQKIKVNKQ